MKKPACAAYVRGKTLRFQIRTQAGAGRHYSISNGGITSAAGLSNNADFAMIFSTAQAGFKILSAKDSKNAFLDGLHDQELNLTGDFVAVMWFQGLTEFLQPAKPVM
jgi:hypothetical protein